MQRGFTLIELLVVIAIIGILGSIVLAALGPARAQSRDAQRVSELQNMAKVIFTASLANSGSFAGCTTAHDNVYQCSSSPNLQKFVDPVVGSAGSACYSASTAQCQYSVSSIDGLSAATFSNWKVCGYLERGSGSLSAGLVNIDSTNATIKAGCL